MTRDGSIAKRTPLADVHELLAIGPVSVRASAGLVDAARAAVLSPATRILSVVDDRDRLVGILPVRRLVEEIVARVAPEDLMVSLDDLAQIGEFGRELSARVAGDLMSDPILLRLTSTVSDAFRVLRDRGLDGAPIVDDDRLVVGYVDLLELALRYLDARPA